MITLAWVYALAGAAFAAFALVNILGGRARRRPGMAAFWALLALSMWAGDRLGDLGNGFLVLALVAIAGLGGLRRGGHEAEVDPGLRKVRAAWFGNRLFLIALVIPLTALAGTLLFKRLPDLVDPRQTTLIALGLGTLLALVAGFALLRPGPLVPLQQGRRLADQVGWAAILPQMLASLGAVFALAGMGDAVGGIVALALPEGNLAGAVLAYGLGMAIFTMAMGNAFAAFPVMMAAIGLPVLINGWHGDPTVISAIGMLAGFCGTLMTPMAANFNLVPAALLELRDQHGVIRRQVGTAIPLLAVNIALIYLLAFPGHGLR